MADLDGFSALFDKFVTQPGSSVDWDKIEKLPANSVRTKNICSIIYTYKRDNTCVCASGP